MTNEVGVALSLASILAAPLLAGGVHRPIMVGLMCASVLGLALMAAAVTIEGRQLRGDLTLTLPALLVAIPLLQSIPVPFVLRWVLDRAGTSLLVDNVSPGTTAWPLSLDPPSTRVYVGRAAAALAAFLFAFHISAGQTRRHLVLRAVGILGVVSVAVGLGHRMVGLDKLYGILNPPGRSLLIGPLVNRNHTSELLELTSFVCLACAFHRPTLLNRTGWIIGAVLCAGGAAATLSRGAALGLAAGILVFAGLQYFRLAGAGQRRPRAAVLWGVGLGGLLAAGMLALGADQLISRFKTDAVSTDVRFRLWRDGLRVLMAHPAGIGRGAFDRIFPIYRSLKMPHPVRFAFLENEPLQYLVDCGWLLFLPILLAFSFVVYRVARRGRYDAVEAALCAGVAALLAHSVVDFGLETMGVLLPFSAVAGTLLGRLRSPEPVEPTAGGPRLVWGAVGLAVIGLVFGAASTAHASNDDFDALLKRVRDRPEEVTLVKRAERTHPLDYLYALDRARLEPLAGSPSPRLHALNRALRLCPSCDTVHEEIARNLWAMGLRRQALLEWRTAIEIQPEVLRPLLGQLFSRGAKPEELLSLASNDSNRMLEVVDFIAAQGRLTEAFVALDQAAIIGAPRGEALLRRAALNLQAGNLEAASNAANAAAAAGYQGPKLSIIRADIIIKQKAADGADQAIAILDAATARYPTDLLLQRERVALVTQYKKWSAAARALEGLKLACYTAIGSGAEAHVAAATIAAQMGRPNDALGEYQMALSDRPNDVGLWMAYGRTAESAGRPATARNAYSEAARLSPKDPTIARALQSVDEYAARARQETAGDPTRLPPTP